MEGTRESLLQALSQDGPPPQLLALKDGGGWQWTAAAPAAPEGPTSAANRLGCWPQQLLPQPGASVPESPAQSLTLATSSLTSLHPNRASCPSACLDTCPRLPILMKPWSGNAEMQAACLGFG